MPTTLRYRSSMKRPAAVEVLDRRNSGGGDQRRARRLPCPWQSRLPSTAYRGGSRHGDSLDAFACDGPFFKTARLSTWWRGRLLDPYSPSQRTLFFTSSAVCRPKKRSDLRSRSLSGTWVESRIPKCCLPSSWYCWFRSLKCRML